MALFLQNHFLEVCDVKYIIFNDNGELFKLSNIRNYKDAVEKYVNNNDLYLKELCDSKFYWYINNKLKNMRFLQILASFIVKIKYYYKNRILYINLDVQIKDVIS